VIKFTTVIVAHVCKYPISLANGAYIINDVRLLSNPLVSVRQMNFRACSSTAIWKLYRCRVTYYWVYRVLQL